MYLFLFKSKNIIHVDIMKTEINKKLGKRIQYLRQQKGLSQEKLAEAIDIATTSLSYIETGRGFMTLATLEKMAKTLDVEIYEIFKFTTDENRDSMYKYIISKFDSIKHDEEKIKIIYNILKNLF